MSGFPESDSGLIAPDGTNTITVTQVGGTTELGVTPDTFAPAASAGSFYAFIYGMAPSNSVAANTTAYNAALAAAIAAGNGNVVLPAGNIPINATAINTQPGTAVIGQGKDVTTLVMTGAGNCIDLHPAVWNGGTTSSTTPTAYVFGEMTIDGANATGTASGFHGGDLQGSYIYNVKIQNFSGAGQNNWWFDNLVGNSERVTALNLESKNGTTNYRFDVNSGVYSGSTLYNAGTTYTSASQIVASNTAPVYFYNPVAGQVPFSGHAQPVGATSNAYWTYVGQSTAAASFGYGFWDLSISAVANQNGIVLNAGAIMTGAKLFGLTGNFSAGTGSNSGAVLTLIGSAISLGGALTYSSITDTFFNVIVECDGTNTGHQTINFASGSNYALYGYGLLYFLNLTTSFASANSNTNFRFGPGNVVGDTKLFTQPYPNNTQSKSANYTTLTSDTAVFCTGSGGFTITLTSTAAPSETKAIYNLSTGNITIAQGSGFSNTLLGAPQGITLAPNQCWKGYQQYGTGWATDSNSQGFVYTGTAVLSAGTIAVANTNITAAAKIKVYVQTPGGTVGAPFVSVITAGTGFTIASSSALDTSTIRYEIEAY